MSREGGGPAFPNVVEHVPTHERHIYTHEYKLIGGMSLRDWFAGMALTKLLSAVVGETWDKYAEASYAMADAMLKERDK